MSENMNNNFNPTVNEFSNQGNAPQNNMSSMPNNGMNPNMNQGPMPNNGMNPNMNQGPMPNNGMNPNMNQGPMPNNGFNPNMQYGPRPNGSSGNKTGLIIGIVVGLIVIGVVVYLLLSGGIGGKTLTCTQSGTTSGVNIAQKMDVKFKGNKASSAKVVMTIKLLDKTYASQWDTLITSLKSQVSSADGVKVTTKDNSANYEYIMNIETDYSKNKAATISGADYESAKALLESEGYTCK